LRESGLEERWNSTDATLEKFELDAEGRVKSQTVFAKASFMKSVDGIFCDRRTDRIYVADIFANAVQVVAPDGTVTTLAQNGDTDGADGSMDAPCEVLIRGSEVVVSNLDRVFPGGFNTKHDLPHTLSVIHMD
jgi:hypothetical protein